MRRQTGRNGIGAIGAASLCLGFCLGASLSAAADAKKPANGDATTLLRKAVLARFDKNGDGRLDPKEKAAALRELTGRDDSDEQLNALRAKVLARFDKNGNGKLERSEVRTALSRLSAKPQSTASAQSASNSAATASVSAPARLAAIIANDPSAAVAFTAQQLTSTGIDAASAEQLAVQRFDLNGDGVLDASELALAQSLLLRQLAQAAAVTSSLSTPVVSSTPLATSTSTGTTGTTGTGQSGSMSGGCTSGTGSTGTSSTGTTGTTGTTTSAAQAANNQRLGSLSSATAGFRSFGRGRGR